MTPEDFFALVDTIQTEGGRDSLDERSQSAIRVTPSDRVLQILAGPGSGKTEVLCWRVLYELFIHGVTPEHLLVTTFTRKAATELSLRLVERSDQLLAAAHTRGQHVPDPRIHSVRVGTIHALCDELLLEFDSQYIESGTALIDDLETKVRLARSLPTLGYERNGNRSVNRLLGNTALLALARKPWGGESSWPNTLLEKVDYLAKLLNLQTETWWPRCGPSNTPNGLEGRVSGITETLENIRSRWENDHLAQNQVLDFATLQKRFVERQHIVTNRLKHVFVDEFQDTNPVQFMLHTNWLTNPNLRLTVVGDDDQSLYRFRGSDISCFSQLEPFCRSRSIAYRPEKLEVNRRSTRSIIAFCGRYRERSQLSTVSMPKQMEAPANSDDGTPVRLVRGPWQDLCRLVAREMETLGIGCRNASSSATAAVLMFSTSESTTRRGPSAALELRQVLEGAGLRVFNSRSKTAASPASPVFELSALLSYFFDPVRKARVEGRTRKVEVWASCNDDANAEVAEVAIPMTQPDPASQRQPSRLRVGAQHADIQKKFRKNGGSIEAHRPDYRDMLEFLDDLRMQFFRTNGTDARLSVSGLVARLLSFPQFAGSSYSFQLFRQALFTKLLEANIAPSRRTMRTLDGPLRCGRAANGKLSWPEQYWTFLNILGQLIDKSRLDDEDIEAFSEQAIAMLTFHQAKGLQFDHVFVAATGREATAHSAILTEVFSGKAVQFTVENGQPVTTEQRILELAQADTDREVYVALTRAKRTLTILHDPTDARPFMNLNSTIQALAPQSAQPLPGWPSILVHSM